MKNKIFSIIQRNYETASGLTDYERNEFRKVLACRTEMVPNLYMRCDHCESVHPVYKSCRNRLCPVCNAAGTIKWLAKRETELLPVGYFLLTFTIPKQLRPLFLANKKTCYSLLFNAAGRCLQENTRNNNRELSGYTGFFSVLHTWDQRLNYHPHIHAVVPAGCLSADRTNWNNSHPSFFLPVRKLSADFRKKLLFYLRKESRNQSLTVPEKIGSLNKLLENLSRIPWVVNSQAPGRNGKPEHIIRYLSRYVNKTAVSDRRIRKIENGNVHLAYYDRKYKCPKTEVISEQLFLKRLSFHILPKCFRKTRFYGFMANRYKSSMIVLCRMHLGQAISEQQDIDKSFTEDTAFLFWKYFRIDITLCPDCEEGHFSIVKGPIKGG